MRERRRKSADSFEFRDGVYIDWDFVRRMNTPNLLAVRVIFIERWIFL